MIFQTVLVSIAACLAVLLVKRPVAIGVLVASMLIYPEYLRVPIGLAEMSVPRFAALVLLLRCISTRQVRQLFKWRALDLVVFSWWAWMILAAVMAGAELPWLTEAIGRIFDTVLMYFVARLCFVEYRDHASLFIPIAICAIIMGVLGVIESVTQWSPYQQFVQYDLFHWYDKAVELRFGFLRAQASTAHSIYFGTSMCFVLAMLISIRRYRSRKLFWSMASLAAALGALSSLSSGPQVTLTALLVINLYILAPRLIMPTVWLIVAMCAFKEVFFQRHFWYMIEYLNFFGGDSWYRCRLLDVALEHWQDYWLVGMAERLPMYWGLLIDGRNHVDIVNHYLIIAVSSGVLGVALFVASQILAIREAVISWSQADRRAKALVFGQAAALVAVALGLSSAGLYGPPLLLNYLLLGMMAQPLAVYYRKSAGKPAAMNGTRRFWRRVRAKSHSKTIPGGVTPAGSRHEGLPV